MSNDMLARLGVTAAVCAGLLGTQVAHADPAQGATGGKTLVVLGDSQSANGNLAGDLPLALPFMPAPTECYHKPTSWPNQLVQLTGLAATHDFVDVSCANASLTTPPGYTAAQETRKAAQMGAFGPRTRLVTLQFGANDKWGTHHLSWPEQFTCLIDLINGCDRDAIARGRVDDPAQVSAADYVSRISPVINYIRYYAPNARILFVGSGAGKQVAGSSPSCLSVGPVTFVQPRAAGLNAMGAAIGEAQYEAAHILGVDYFDISAVTQGHDACSADPWVNGYFSTHAEVDGMPGHPTARGDAATATGIAPLLKNHR